MVLSNLHQICGSMCVSLPMSVDEHRGHSAERAHLWVVSSISTEHTWCLLWSYTRWPQCSPKLMYNSELVDDTDGAEATTSDHEPVWRWLALSLPPLSLSLSQPPPSHSVTHSLSLFVSLSLFLSLSLSHTHTHSRTHIHACTHTHTPAHTHTQSRW